jgi:hypothetical protein
MTTKVPVELSSTPGIVDGSNATAITIDSSERVGIGESSPDELLVIGGDVKIKSTNKLHFTNTSDQTSIHAPASNTMAFTTNSTERMRIDSSGNLLVGKTSSGALGTAGFELAANDTLRATKSASAPVEFNRLSDDGEIAIFYKDTSKVGSIGTAGSALVLGNGNAGFYFNSSLSTVMPWNITNNTNSDAAIDIGQSANRFKDLYLSGGAYIGGTGSANYLDDYEEGTWTPVVDGSTGTPTVSYVFRDATYVKVGRWIKLFCRIRMSSSSGGSGNLKITGLPFAINSNSDEAGGSIGLALGFSTLPTVLQVDDGSNSILVMADQGNNAITDLDWAYLYFNVDYLTNT